ncbi:hypothetical protein A7W90_08835 [Clostridium sp. Bc-iso-3]|nr:hypothetical protein A7W90_08835 [Clostridium sp. Bc-iso-3]
MHYIHHKSSKQSAKNSMVKNIALMICTCIIIASFLSAAFILTRANHEHDHEGPNGTCATCIHLASTENILKQVSIAIITSVFAFVPYVFFCMALTFQ